MSSSCQLFGRCGSGDGVRGAPQRHGATHAATASQSRISRWNGAVERRVRRALEEGVRDVGAGEQQHTLHVRVVAHVIAGLAAAQVEQAREPEALLRLQSGPRERGAHHVLVEHRLVAWGALDEVGVAAQRARRDRVRAFECSGHVRDLPLDVRPRSLLRVTSKRSGTR